MELDTQKEEPNRKKYKDKEKKMRSKEEIERQIKELKAEIRLWKNMYDSGKASLEEYGRAVSDKEYYIRVLKYALGEFEWLDVICAKEI